MKPSPTFQMAVSVVLDLLVLLPLITVQITED